MRFHAGSPYGIISGRCEFLRTASSESTNQILQSLASIEREVDTEVTRPLELRNSQELHVEALDEFEPKHTRVKTWTRKVELASSGSNYLEESIAESIPPVGVRLSDDTDLENVIDALAPGHGEATRATPERALGDFQSVQEETQKTLVIVPDGLTGCNAARLESGIDQLYQDNITAAFRTNLGRDLPRTQAEKELDVHGLSIDLGTQRLLGRTTDIGDCVELQRSRHISPEYYAESLRSSRTIGTGAGLTHQLPERIGGVDPALEVQELIQSLARFSAPARIGGSQDVSGAAEGFTIRETSVSSPSEGNKIPERIGTDLEGESTGKSLESQKGKEEKLHSREEAQRQGEFLEDRRSRPRLEVASTGGISGGVEIEEPKALRPTRPSGGKDRHSKVNTAKGPRDRRVRLSVPTAVQFYDVQDRLGFDQPSKAVEWLIHKAKDAIDELGRAPIDLKEGMRMQNVFASPDMSHQIPTHSSFGGATLGFMTGCNYSTPPSSITFQPTSVTPYADQLNFLMDPSFNQGMFTSLQSHQGQVLGTPFNLARLELPRVSCGSGEGARSIEIAGSPLARVESRTKARERARERTKKYPGSQGKYSEESPPSASQNPMFHSTPSYASLTPASSIQGHPLNLSAQNPRQNHLLSGLYEEAGSSLSRLLQGSHQAGHFSNVIHQNASSDLEFNERISNPLQSAFLVQPQASLQDAPTHLSSLQPPQPQVLQVGSQEAFHLGTAFNPRPSSSSFVDTSMPSSIYPPVATLPPCQHQPIHNLSSLGISHTSHDHTSHDAHYLTRSHTPIPPGFSPGPPASAFRAHVLSNPNPQQSQGAPRVQRPIPSFTSSPTMPSSQAGSSPSRSRVVTSHFYLGSSSNSPMGDVPSISSDGLDSPDFTSTSAKVFEVDQRSRSAMGNPYRFEFPNTSQDSRSRWHRGARRRVESQQQRNVVSRDMMES